jgi:hypothetical protein
MTTLTLVSLSPIFNDAQFFDDSGAVLNSGKIFTYEAGSNSSELPTYTDPSGNTLNPNPIVLDSAGRLPNEIWLVNGSSYNLVLTYPDGTTVIKSADNIKGIMPANIPGIGSDLFWNIINEVPVYLSGTQFYVAGVYTSELQVGNRIQYIFTDNSFGYGTITVCQIVPDVDTNYRTVVTFVPDNVVFNNSVTGVFWGSATATNQIVDAGGVTFTPDIDYTIGSTVGTELQKLLKIIQSNNLTYDTTGTAPNYVITPLYQPDTISDTQYNVKFTTESWGVTATLTVGNFSTKPLKQYDSGGNLVNPMVAANQVARVGYDGTNLVILTPLPSTPAGTVVYFAADSAPQGWLVCDGASYTSGQYPTLFDVIGTTFGGSGTTFYVPDLLGKFIRSWDDGADVDPGRTFGSSQDDAMSNHLHGFGYEDGNNEGYFLQGTYSYDTTGLSGYINWNGSGGGIGGGSVTNPMTIYLSTTNQHILSGENRPINVALLPCIKY